MPGATAVRVAVDDGVNRTTPAPASKLPPDRPTTSKTAWSMGSVTSTPLAATGPVLPTVTFSTTWSPGFAGTPPGGCGLNAAETWSTPNCTVSTPAGAVDGSALLASALASTASVAPLLAVFATSPSSSSVVDCPAASGARAHSALLPTIEPLAAFAPSRPAGTGVRTTRPSVGSLPAFATVIVQRTASPGTTWPPSMSSASTVRVSTGLRTTTTGGAGSTTGAGSTPPLTEASSGTGAPS